MLLFHTVLAKTIKQLSYQQQTPVRNINVVIEVPVFLIRLMFPSVRAHCSIQWELSDAATKPKRMERKRTYGTGRKVNWNRIPIRVKKKEKD
jgi:hypothetical protein